MPSPRPTEQTDWATGAASITVPTQAERDAGWIAEEDVDEGIANWFFNLLHLWNVFISKTTAWYEDLEVAITGLSDGDWSTIWEDDNATGPGVVLVEKTTVNQSVRAFCDTTGDLTVIGIGDSDPIALSVPRDLDGAESGGAPTATFTRTNSGANDETLWVITDGAFVVAGYQTLIGTQFYVECWNAVTGASVWVKDTGTRIPFDGCIAGDKVVFIHDETSAGNGVDLVNDRNLHAYTVSTGAFVWAYAHSATAGGTATVCSDGLRVYFVHTVASTFGSGARIRSIRAADGFDVDNEGASTGVDTSGRAWNSTNAFTPLRQSATDGQRIYVVDTAAGVKALGAGDGATEWTKGLPAGEVGQDIVCDQDYVLVASNDEGATPEGRLLALDKVTGHCLWRWAPTDLTADFAGMAAVTSDGSRVVCVARDEPRVYQLTRGNIPHPFRRRTDQNGIRKLKMQPEVS